jgi:hypothetical protein
MNKKYIVSSLLVILIVIGGNSFAVGAQSGTSYTICINKKTKAMRFTSVCTSLEVKKLIFTSSAQGATGLQGPAGPAGPQGVTGPQGATGQQGPAGVSNVSGPQGATGPRGEMGLQGPAGVSNVPGPQGLSGMPGLKGDRGLTGDSGIPGTIGETGPPGPSGFFNVVDTNGNVIGKNLGFTTDLQSYYESHFTVYLNSTNSIWIAFPSGAWETLAPGGNGAVFLQYRFFSTNNCTSDSYIATAYHPNLFEGTSISYELPNTNRALAVLRKDSISNTQIRSYLNYATCVSGNTAAPVSGYLYLEPTTRPSGTALHLEPSN